MKASTAGCSGCAGDGSPDLISKGAQRRGHFLTSAPYSRSGRAHSRNRPGSNTPPHTAMAIGTIRGAQIAVAKNGRIPVCLRMAWATGCNGPGNCQDSSVCYTRPQTCRRAFEPNATSSPYAYAWEVAVPSAADPQGNVVQSPLHPGMSEARNTTVTRPWRIHGPSAI